MTQLSSRLNSVATLGLLASLLAACASPPPVPVAATAPPLVLEAFFPGRTVGEGVFTNSWTGSERRFDVVIDSPGGLVGPKGMDPAVVKILADAFRAAAQEPRHLEFLANLDQPLLLLDGPAYRDEMAKTVEVERDLLRKLNLLPPA